MGDPHAPMVPPPVESLPESGEGGGGGLYSRINYGVYSRPINLFFCSSKRGLLVPAAATTKTGLGELARISKLTTANDYLLAYQGLISSYLQLGLSGRGGFPRPFGGVSPRGAKSLRLGLGLGLGCSRSD